jgi:phosphoglycerol transferase MdoB-like AlkP superfamily enzyme
MQWTGFLLIVIQLTFSLIDIELYKTWDSIFSVRAYKYLFHPLEITNNVDNQIFVFAFFSLTILTLIYKKIFKHFILPVVKEYATSPRAHRIILFPFLLGFTFLALRGGFRQIPLNQSDAFFCENRTYNIAAINSTWNFANVLIQHEKLGAENAYLKMTAEEAQMKIEELFRTGGVNQQTIFNLKDTPPNIIIITMEGISSELMNPDIKKSHLPYIQSLKSVSYSFERAYAIGFRTEQGLSALLSGTLTTPYNNITDNVNILKSLPSILTGFEKRNYTSAFIFGGDIEFANTLAYLKELNFNTIIDKNDYPLGMRTQKLGVPDAYLFDKAFDFVRNETSSYFLQIMTLSSHQPFDIPNVKISPDADIAYENSAEYVDSCIAKFIQKLQKTKQWSNTIVIITSDHSHKYPSAIDIATPERFHIPFIIYSPLLQAPYKGFKDSAIFAQNNFPATFSHLLNWREKNYTRYSLNHFSNSKKFCFSAFVNGYLFQVDTQKLQFDYIWRPIDTTNEQIVRQHSYPMAIMQTLVDEIREANLQEVRYKAR